jgi:exosortase A-associated hydrolase 2
MPPLREAWFLEARDGARFAVATRPTRAPRGAILYIHPFAEEMNKSRRMASLAAQAFASQGWFVLQIDLRGCGDSSGELDQVDWSDWVDDVELAWRWLQSNVAKSTVVWSLRAGSLVVSDWLQQSNASAPLLLWQPVIDGAQHLTQFLRLKAVNEMLNAADTRSAVSTLRSSLTAGQPVEVAGYGLSPSVAAGFDRARTRLPAGYRSPIAIIEARGGDDPAVSPAVSSLATEWGACAKVSVAVARSVAFWQTQEIETSADLIARSEAHLRELSA